MLNSLSKASRRAMWLDREYFPVDGQQTRLLPNNPRELLLDDALQLYEAAL